MVEIREPMHDPMADRWVRGEISNEEWKAHVLAKHRAREQQLAQARALSAPSGKRRRWWSRLGL